MIDLKLLTFITVAKIKNFTRAARILNITQPAVSQHIRALEQYYNVKLLHKDGKEMKVTQEGKLLLKYALELERISKMIKIELNNKSSIINRYFVGATLTIGGYVLPEIIGKYRRLHENTDIILYVENTQSIIKRLFSGDISLGVVEGPFNKSKVKYKKFKDDELVLALSPDHDLANEKSVTIEDVLKNKLILREEGSGTRKFFENKLIEAGYNLEDMNIYMEIGNITALISLVEANIGCTIISKEAIKGSLESNKLKVIPIDNFKIIREFNFIYLDHIHETFINDFIRFCNKN
ncbi:LysR family transcriptional regulator [Anaeromicrobium sediminis]|uniref:LysR family transcriptional regulator n=1 Tax=Anaeromicrobium sediminis TaxID=1478221 RepID=A0A267MJW2_9FIRM|nr:LysR family transcriptional regulator [Anaeromicrobium sediminis]PAB59859.1 LysR family transcriptional regulator [Anaeromicrobium sediminis]